MSLPNYANLEFGNNNMVSASKKIMSFERQASDIYRQSNEDPLTSTGTSPKDAVDEMLLGLNEINANISQLKTYTDESKKKERKYAPTREAFDNAIEAEANKLGNIPMKIPQINLHKNLDVGTFQPFKLMGSGLEEQEILKEQINALEKQIRIFSVAIKNATSKEIADSINDKKKPLDDAVKELKRELDQDILESASIENPIKVKIKKTQPDTPYLKAQPDPDLEQEPVLKAQPDLGQEPDLGYEDVDITELNRHSAQMSLFKVDHQDFNDAKSQGKSIIKEYDHTQLDGSITTGYAKYPKTGDSLPKKYETFYKGVENFKFKFGSVPLETVQQIQTQTQENIQQRIDENLIESPSLNPIISVLTKLTTLIAKQSVLFNGRIKKNINYLDRVEIDNLVNAVNKSISLFNQIDFDFISVVINNGNNMIGNVVNAFNKLSRDVYLGSQSYTTTYKGGMILNHLHGRTVRQNPYNYKYLM